MGYRKLSNSFPPAHSRAGKQRPPGRQVPGHHAPPGVRIRTGAPRATGVLPAASDEPWSPERSVATRRCRRALRDDGSGALDRLHRRSNQAWSGVVVGRALPPLPDGGRRPLLHRGPRAAPRDSPWRRIRTHAQVPDRGARTGVARPGLRTSWRPESTRRDPARSRGTHASALRGLGRRALVRLQAAGPQLWLLTLCALLLFFAAQMPEPFEDGYAHWLIAANLASTGQLHDPLFGMQDTWLPGYHVLAAGVLHTFGLWQLGALKALGALLGLITLACVYALAETVRQARLAVALLALNPVFLFTSGSAVVEPLLTALLTGAALAAVRGRMKVAALLAVLACMTATKAWIWIVAVAGFAAVDLLHQRSRSRVPAMAWAVPAIALLVFLQLGFAPASHSIARGSLEAGSATARGSLPLGAPARVFDLAKNFGLAALPLFVLGVPGLWIVIRHASRRRESATLRFLHFPALVYLGAVIGLVAAGAYTGSHRYLYPVLPSLALLAAGALDRHSGVVRLGSVAACGLLAIAFLPVFAGFASNNRGLIAAGRAASNSPGLLITDSPVVAYYSGKAATRVTGSQQLPLERALAIEWMRDHGATAIVMENITYYRASVVFPDLAMGRASPPFKSLGDQSSYQVPRGKPIYAYHLMATSQSIYPGVSAVISPMPAQGKTAVLAKGLTLRASGVDITGEGMGFGLPMVHYTDGWVYSRTSTTIDLWSDIE